MSVFRIYRVLELPAETVPNAFYYVKDGENAQAYLTNNEGEIFPIISGEIVESNLNFYEHVQSSSLAVWTVNHNLGRKPVSVRVLSIGGVEVEAEVVDVSDNQLQVVLTQAQQGRVLVI